MFERRKDTGHPHETMLSVFREHGVVQKDSRENLNQTAEDRNIYQLVDNGWLAVNRMKAWQGSVGISRYRGIVSGHYLCFRPRHGEHHGYLNWMLRSGPYIAEYQLLSRGARPGQAEIDNDLLRSLPVMVPPLDEQRRIADFLDDQVARIDAVAEACRTRSALAARRLSGRLAEELLQPGNAGPVPWREDRGWLMAPVGAMFALDLGKMLNEERAAGDRLRPYLRNTNVQWDRIDSEDLKLMQFAASERLRYQVLPGDLLICEGGQPGRAAVWDGRIPEVYFQKALHRARPRRGNHPRWLLYCLRLCVERGAFDDAGGTTIAHLTREQLRELRLPFPPVPEQARLVQEWDAMQEISNALVTTTNRQIDLLQERKRALITAAVTGEFDMSTASGRP